MSDTTLVEFNVESLTGFSDDEFEELSLIDQEIIIDLLRNEHMESHHAELLSDAAREDF